MRPERLLARYAGSPSAGSRTLLVRATAAGSGPNTLRVLVQLGVTGDASPGAVPELSNSPTTNRCTGRRARSSTGGTL